MKKNLIIILGIELKTIYEPIRYLKYLRLVPGSSGNNIFQHPTFGRITIQNYFQRHYGRQLRFPFMPLVQVNPQSANILIPIEMLCISDKPQRIYNKLSLRQLELISKVKKIF